MIQAWLRDLIQENLSDYIVDHDDLTFNVFKGAEFTNLILNADGVNQDLEEAEAPVRMTAGSISSIKLKPKGVQGLTQNKWEIEANGVNVVLQWVGNKQPQMNGRPGARPAVAPKMMTTNSPNGFHPVMAGGSPQMAVAIPPFQDPFSCPPGTGLGHSVPSEGLRNQGGFPRQVVAAPPPKPKAGSPYQFNNSKTAAHMGVSVTKPVGKSHLDDVNRGNTPSKRSKNKPLGDPHSLVVGGQQNVWTEDHRSSLLNNQVPSYPHSQQYLDAPFSTLSNGFRRSYQTPPQIYAPPNINGYVQNTNYPYNNLNNSLQPPYGMQNNIPNGIPANPNYPNMPNGYNNFQNTTMMPFYH